MEITDPNDERLRNVQANGQNEAYLVLTAEERDKGFVRPVRDTYIHSKCGTTTIMSQGIAETYARNPTFYGRTFCASCGTHLGVDQFNWKDGSILGS